MTPASAAAGPVRVGLLGLGTVGGGTVQVLRRNRDELKRRAGRPIEVCVAAVRDPARARPFSTQGLRLCTDPMAVVHDPQVDVVVELIGGVQPAVAMVLAAVEAGKHVVTANKALIAEHGNELFAAARRSGVMVGFEAAVAGGIPIIKVLREGLAGNRIQSLTGIINGTCNYVLCAMDRAGAGFADALAEAQRLGYAEADPRMDIEGFDAAHKLTILAALAFGIPLQYARVYREGITGITAADVTYARELGYRIRHLGIARRRAAGLELRVHPALIPARHILAGVDGVLNAVHLMGDAVGETLYCGPGAGAEPTASAVIADLLDIARASGAGPGQQVPHLAFQPDALSDAPVLPAAHAETGYYLRMNVEDQPGVLAGVAGIFGAAGISIEAVLQKEPAPGARRVPLILLTQRVAQGDMQRALERVQALAAVEGPITGIRIEHMDTVPAAPAPAACS